MTPECPTCYVVRREQASVPGHSWPKWERVEAVIAARCACGKMTYWSTGAKLRRSGEGRPLGLR